VAGDLGDKVKIVKVDVDQNPDLASQLQVRGAPTWRGSTARRSSCRTAPPRVTRSTTHPHSPLPRLQISGLPTMIFIGTDRTKPALRTEGLLPADTIKDIVAKEL
jgi:hypothetical protein